MGKVPWTGAELIGGNLSGCFAARGGTDAGGEVADLKRVGERRDGPVLGLADERVHHTHEPGIGHAFVIDSDPRHDERMAEGRSREREQKVPVLLQQLFQHIKRQRASNAKVLKHGAPLGEDGWRVAERKGVLRVDTARADCTRE